MTTSCNTVISQISVLVDMEAMAAGTEAAQFEVEDSRVGGRSLAYRDSSARECSDHDHLLSLHYLISPHCSVEGADCRLRIKSYKCYNLTLSYSHILVFFYRPRRSQTVLLGSQ